MKKVLFLGNSHVGAFKLACSNSDYGFNVGFVGVPDAGFDILKIHENLLTVPCELERFIYNVSATLSSDSKSFNIQLDRFDFIVYLKGLSRLDPRLLYTADRKSILAPKFSKSLLKTIFLSGEPSPTRKINGTSPSTIYFDLIRTFCKNTFFLGAPLPSSSIIESFSYNTIQNVKYNSSCIREIACESLCDSSLPNVLVPPESVCHESSIYSKKEFFVESVNWNGCVKPGIMQQRDVSHVGDRYADILIREMLTSLFSKS